MYGISLIAAADAERVAAGVQQLQPFLNEPEPKAAVIFYKLLMGIHDVLTFKN